MSGIPVNIRQKVIIRAKGCCEYCQLSTTGQIAPFPVDHIHPRTDGGKTILENLALSCPRCNAYKWAFQFGVDPDSGEEHPLYNPRTGNWNKHFQWTSDGSMKLEGKTPIGRATIGRLKMNHEDILLTRKILATLKITPPPT